jgi:thioredoxin 1
MESFVEADAINWAQEVSKSTILTVVYFWHEQCPYCYRLNPIFSEVAHEYSGRIKFVKLNVLENPANREIAAQNGVMGTPTMMFFCNGRPIGQVVGLMSKQELEALMNDTLNKYKNCLTLSTDLRSYIV